jgi:hypothetical protein
MDQEPRKAIKEITEQMSPEESTSKLTPWLLDNDNNDYLVYYLPWLHHCLSHEIILHHAL